MPDAGGRKLYRQRQQRGQIVGAGRWRRFPTSVFRQRRIPTEDKSTGTTARRRDRAFEQWRSGTHLDEDKADTASGSADENVVALLDGVCLAGEGQGRERDSTHAHAVAGLNVGRERGDLPPLRSCVLGKRGGGGGPDALAEGELAQAGLGHGDLGQLDDGSDNVLSHDEGQGDLVQAAAAVWGVSVHSRRRAADLTVVDVVGASPLNLDEHLVVLGRGDGDVAEDILLGATILLDLSVRRGFLNRGVRGVGC